MAVCCSDGLFFYISPLRNVLPPCLVGHAIFKLTYLSNHDYKPLYFESDAATVNEIVLKVSSAAPPMTASVHVFYAHLDNKDTILICWHSLRGLDGLENQLHLNKDQKNDFKWNLSLL